VLLARKYRPKSLAANLSLLLFLSVVPPASAAEHLEIQIRLNSTFKSPRQTNEHEKTAICILGTNDWYISGAFTQNADIEYWLTGTTVLERRTINSSMYLQQAKDYLSEKIGTKSRLAIEGAYPRKGQIYTRTIPWLEPFGYGMERAVWLAFCSGSFLRAPGRQVPLPIGPYSQSQGYSDKTVFLEDHSGLSPPKTVDLLTPMAPWPVITRCWVQPTFLAAPFHCSSV